MKPLEALTQNRDAIRTIVSRFRVTNPRVFGSVVHGNDKEGSDLDLLVDALHGVTLVDLCSLQNQLQDLLGISVDLRTPEDISTWFRDEVLSEATPL